MTFVAIYMGQLRTKYYTKLKMMDFLRLRVRLYLNTWSLDKISLYCDLYQGNLQVKGDKRCEKQIQT